MRWETGKCAAVSCVVAREGAQSLVPLTCQSTNGERNLADITKSRRSVKFILIVWWTSGKHNGSLLKDQMREDTNENCELTTEPGPCALKMEEDYHSRSPSSLQELQKARKHCLSEYKPGGTLISAPWPAEV